MEERRAKLADVFRQFVARVVGRTTRDRGVASSDGGEVVRAPVLPVEMIMRRMTVVLLLLRGLAELMHVVVWWLGRRMAVGMLSGKGGCG